MYRNRNSQIDIFQSAFQKLRRVTRYLLLNVALSVGLRSVYWSMDSCSELKLVSITIQHVGPDEKM